MNKMLVVILFTMFAQCTLPKQISAPVPPVFDWQGHRGCRGLMPENTIPAMLLALDLGVTTLEMDVVITKDKKVLLSHEPWFGSEISTRPDGSLITPQDEHSYLIYEMTYEETKAFDVGLKPHPRFPAQKKIRVSKPLLEDVLDTVQKEMIVRKRTYPFFNIETKTTATGDGLFHPAPGEFVELLMAVIQKKKMEDFLIVQSFDIRTLQYLHRHYPGIRTAILIEETDKTTPGAMIKKLGFTPDIWSPHFSLIHAKLPAQCHSMGMKLIPWTINDAKKAAELKRLGVDGLITDFPDMKLE